MSDGPDREAILARRALLVSAAATALGCTLPGQGIADRPLARAPLPSWTLFVARRPPLQVDTRVPSPDREALKALEARLGSIYEALRTSYDALAAAWQRPSDERAIREASDAMSRLVEQIEDLRPACGDSSSSRTSHVLRRRAHLAFLDGAAKQLKEAVSTFPSAPRSFVVGVCLSCAIDDRFVVRDVVPFAADASTSVAALPSFAEASDTPVRVVVNGHADASEQSPEELSKRRAEHVRDRLLEGGFPRERIEIRAIADAIPLDPPGGPNNRRVDFDVTG